ncbi:MAG TPA: M28 family metallopeptidase [Bryobacteraceae bacterium]|nr:M28 family metallopeptidase [Bryobacteraceae bacterium]
MKTAACSLLLLVFSAAPGTSADPPAILGFTAESARAEREWETKFRALPDPANLRQYMQRLAAHPHHVGSPYDRQNAEWILSKFQEWGLDAKIETYDVLFPTPKERQLELIEPARFTAKLVEPAVAGDPTSSQQDEQLPSYNAYSIDGDVTAPLVYVNYGAPDDYEQLDRLGISVQGAIVIARYGQTWRGIKPKVAAEHGAVACLIYSDPRDDGYFEGDVYPQGPFRNRDGVQRGSVMDMPLYPGDPLTPGVGATKAAQRLSLAEAKTLTRIPTLPISYGDAQPLLTALTGPVVPERWRGGLPITYHAGPGPSKVHLKLSFNWDTKTIYDVIARIPGSTDPDEWILRGNHHDAWVNGATDPVSGAIALLEEARALGVLLKQGWRPKRTIVYCVWDAEEPGLIGSTEWAEDHREELNRKAAVYINSDGNGRGFLTVSGSHTLEKFINSVAREVQDPETHLTVWKRLQLRRIGGQPQASGATTTPVLQDRQEIRQRADLRIGALGSGSDYSAFLDHLGVASLDIGFSGEGQGGVYHSVYDDPNWYTHFADTDFAYGRTLAETIGLAVLRLAASDVLPYEFSDFSDTIRRYVDEIDRLARTQRADILERNREIDEGVFAARNDPAHPTVPPAKETVPPFVNLAPLHNGLTALESASEAYGKSFARAIDGGAPALARASLREVNANLIAVERALTLDDGLPGRPWYRHQIYAPGFFTGYDVKTLPGVRESLEQKQWKLAEEQALRLERVLQSAGEKIRSAAAQLDRAAP